jgi:choline-sulfatase
VPVLAILSVVWGAGAAFVFRRLSNRTRALAAIDRMVAHALELPLFMDEPAVVLRAARDLLRANARLFGAIWLPCALMAGSFALVYEPLNDHFGYGPLAAGHAAVITAQGIAASGLRLETSPAVAVETPGIRALAKDEISWRVRPVSAGPQTFLVTDGSRVFRARRAPLTRTGDAAVARIEVPWPGARYFHLPWLAWFFILSFVGAIVFRCFGPIKRTATIAITLFFCGGVKAQTPVILISVDTLRADHLSSYGYRRVRTPHIDALARGGTLFGQIDSQIPLTLPSHASLLMSAYPAATGVEENGALVPPNSITLASVLKAHGYRTAAFIGSIVLDRRYGLNQGFDTYDSPFDAGAGPQNPFSSRVTRDANLVFRSARVWLDANRDKPLFAFIHLYDLHLPYKLPGYSPVEPSLTGYDAELEYVDAAAGRFIESLERNGLWQRAIVILLADHGESLGEHGESGHGYFIYESTIHVPLLIHWPADWQRAHPAQVNEPGGLIDVAPTILEALKLPPPGSFHGKSLFGGARPVLSESMYARDAFGWAGLRSIRTGGEKLIEAPRAELYNLGSDTGELHNLAGARAGGMASLKQRLDTISPPAGARREAPSAGQQALRSLGYIAGPAGAVNSHSSIDPKDRIREFESYTRAIGLMYTGRAREAVSLLRTVLANDPRNDAMRVDLGHAYLDAGRPAEALREWDAILAREPGFTPASEAEGFYWMEKLDFAYAEAAFEKTLRVAPRDYEANFAMAIVEEKLGKPAEAERRRKIMCEISPSTPGCGAALWWTPFFGHKNRLFLDGGRH